MNWIGRYLFPRNNLLNFFIVASLSGAISFLLIGSQIYKANWGLIDDHDIFDFLGPGLHLSPSDIWSTLLAKTEIGTMQARYRPGYYILKLIETSLWGDNVHLWYLARTIGFAIFLGSIWWFMRRFAGLWLSGVLTVCIALLPLWSGIWARLGPSEIYGAGCIGVMVYASYFILFCGRPWARNVSAIALSLSTIALVGMKETFIPIVGGTFAVFILAGIRKKLSLPVIAILVLPILASIGGLVLIVKKQVAGGEDGYAKPVELRLVLESGAKGLLLAIKRTWGICLASILSFAALYKLSPRLPAGWIAATIIAIAAYGFMVVTYALQCALYRSGFPLNSRYDFPAMLLVPLSLCIFVCYIFYMARDAVSERTLDYAQLATAALVPLVLSFGVGHPDGGKTLTAAVRTNIETTNEFYNELQLAVRAAEESPASPIILEAYGPGAYEPVFSLMAYLPALGARNRISVRLHPEEKSHGKLYDGLQESLSSLEGANGGVLVPLRDSLANRAHGCISIAINGAPDAGCSGFQVKTL